MSILEHTPSHVQTLEDLLTRRESIVKLLALTDTELLEKYGWTPPAVVNQCAHPDRPVFGTLDAQSRPGCRACVTASHGVPPRVVVYLAKQRLSATELAWANRDLDGELAREWRDNG